MLIVGIRLNVDGNRDVLPSTVRRSLLLLILALVGVWLTSFTTQVAGQSSANSPGLANCIKPPTVSGNLSLSICTSKIHYSLGETVAFVGILANTGDTPVQLSIMSSSSIVMDRVDSLILREAGFNFCTPSTSCLIPAGQSMTVAIANWFTDDPLSQAKLSGPYTAFVGLTACPTNGPCLGSDFSSLRIVVSVPQN